METAPPPEADAQAQAQADPSLRESYRTSRGTPLEAMARRPIRGDHIKRLRD